LVKVIKFYCDLKNILLILSFILLIIFTNISIKNGFSDNQSILDLNLGKSKQNSITNQSFTNSNLQNLKSNFFYLKNNKLFVPINFYSEEKSILDNAIYVKEKNAIILILNPTKFNSNIIIVQIPRSIIDSKTPSNKDNKFTVLINDKPSKFLEITQKNESDKKLTLDNRTINSFLNNTHNRELSIKFGKDAKVIEISGTDLSKNQNHTQPQDNWFSITISIFFISLSILSIIIIFFYKRGRRGFLEIFKTIIKKNKSR
jgi:hypothetical protein